MRNVQVAPITAVFPSVVAFEEYSQYRPKQDRHLLVQPGPEAEGQAPAAAARAEAVPSASLRCAITSPMAARVAGVPAMGFSIAKS